MEKGFGYFAANALEEFLIIFAASFFAFNMSKYLNQEYTDPNFSFLISLILVFVAFTLVAFGRYKDHKKYK